MILVIIYLVIIIYDLGFYLYTLFIYSLFILVIIYLVIIISCYMNRETAALCLLCVVPQTYISVQNLYTILLL